MRNRSIFKMVHFELGVRVGDQVSINFEVGPLWSRSILELVYFEIHPIWNWSILRSVHVENSPFLKLILFEVVPFWNIHYSISTFSVLLSLVCLADSAFGLPSIGKSRTEATISSHGTNCSKNWLLRVKSRTNA